MEYTCTSIVISVRQIRIHLTAELPVAVIAYLLFFLGYRSRVTEYVSGL